MVNYDAQAIQWCDSNSVYVGPHTFDLTKAVVGVPNTFNNPGYYGSTSEIIAYVSNLTEGNIKAGVAVGRDNGDSSNSIVGTFTSDATANAGQILNGQTAYVNGNKITGTMPDRGIYQYSGGIESGNDGNSYLSFNNIPEGYYHKNGLSWAPEVRAKQSDIANYIGLTSDKLVKGNTVLGVSGNVDIRSLGGTITESKTASFTNVNSVTVDGFSDPGVFYRYLAFLSDANGYLIGIYILDSYYNPNGALDTNLYTNFSGWSVQNWISQTPTTLTLKLPSTMSGSVTVILYNI